MHSMQVFQAIQVMQIIRVMQEVQISLAHLWVDFQVISIDRKETQFR